MSLEEEILNSSKTVAIVGLSPKKDRPSYGGGSYLKEHGYRIIPINPAAEEIIGEKSYPDLSSIPEKVDVVDIFRRSEDVVPIVEEAIKIGARFVWMQEDVTNDEAAELAREAGLSVVMNKCMRKMHMKINGIMEPEEEILRTSKIIAVVG
ncbi:MAG: CoA-binding protein, partial [Planctomycetes bacterium]|nr:CoA-binding protein [Planctomycetota bacterium]